MNTISLGNEADDFEYAPFSQRGGLGKARLLQFVEAGAPDAARFQAILARHGLLGAWRKVERQFLIDAP